VLYLGEELSRWQQYSGYVFGRIGKCSGYCLPIITGTQLACSCHAETVVVFIPVWYLSPHLIVNCFISSHSISRLLYLTYHTAPSIPSQAQQPTQASVPSIPAAAMRDWQIGLAASLGSLAVLFVLYVLTQTAYSMWGDRYHAQRAIEEANTDHRTYPQPVYAPTPLDAYTPMSTRTPLPPVVTNQTRTQGSQASGMSDFSALARPSTESGTSDTRRTLGDMSVANLTSGVAEGGPAVR
jgi:hypothetical protein